MSTNSSPIELPAFGSPGYTPGYDPSLPDPSTQAISFRGLSKQFNGVNAVTRLTFDIPRGSFYGLVGPNGAGKTTAISMATGLLRPDVGSVFISGFDVWQQPFEAKQRFGLLADGLPTFDRLSGLELLQFTGALRGIDEATTLERAHELLDILDLSDAGNKMVVDYSAGMTKKILLAQALIHRPEILILDEPLEAVDPVSAQIIREILRNFVAGGGTVVLSSHVMELVEGLCTHVAIMKEGEILTSGTTDEVRGEHSLNEQFLRLVGGGTLRAGSLGWLRQ